MDDKTLQALTALANKLGTTAEYLWGVLVRQAPITGAIDLAVMGAWGVGCVLLVRFVQRKTCGDEPKWGDELGRILAWCGVLGVCAVVAIIVGFQFSPAMTAIVNPEYWALRQVFR